MTKRRLGLLLAGCALLAYGFSGGCYAQRLPDPPSAADAAVFSGPPLPYSVVVTPWTSGHGQADPDAYAKPAFQWLENSGAFLRVRLGKATDADADFTATPTGEYCNTAAIPLLTGISLGIIPTIFTDTKCEGVEFRRTGARGRTGDAVVIKDQITGKVVMGWAAIPLGFMPGWTHGEAANSGRASQRAKLAILANSARLAALGR